MQEADNEERAHQGAFFLVVLLAWGVVTLLERCKLGVRALSFGNLRNPQPQKAVMSAKEAKARIKINKLLEDAGWRFFDDSNGSANIILEPNVKLVQSRIDALGENFEKTSKGFIDFLLLDEKGFPLLVLEAKSEDKNPLSGKEQARKYAKSQNCRFVILSNGNLHYFWDLAHGNPYIISRFPKPDSIVGYSSFNPNPERLATEPVAYDYIALTQNPGYVNEAGWKNESERPEFIEKNKLRFLRDYQLRAVKSIQSAVSEGASRFLFEMATGTGKTLIAAAIIKLFLRTGNARRVLFLVDRLELEDQANKTFLFSSAMPSSRVTNFVPVRSKTSRIFLLLKSRFSLTE